LTDAPVIEAEAVEEVPQSPRMKLLEDAAAVVADAAAETVEAAKTRQRKNTTMNIT